MCILFYSALHYSLILYAQYYYCIDIHHIKYSKAILNYIYVLSFHDFYFYHAIIICYTNTYHYSYMLHIVWTILQYSLVYQFVLHCVISYTYIVLYCMSFTSFFNLVYVMGVLDHGRYVLDLPRPRSSSSPCRGGICSPRWCPSTP